MNWKQLATNVRWNINPFIDGRYRTSSSNEFADNLNPANESILCKLPIGAAGDVDQAVAVARERFEDGCWSAATPRRRAEALLKLADLIVEHRFEFALLDCLEMGKPIRAAISDAEDFAPGLLRSWAGFADKLTGTSAAVSGGALYFNTYQPRGVVGAISPWNFPLVNAVHKMGPALAAGNSVVLKPSEVASSSALRLAELVLEAGIPPGVFNVVPGLGTTVGEALALHSDVDMLSFTGSTATGRKIMKLAGSSNGKPLLLECGGKSPQVVFDDVHDLDVVADAIVESCFRNQGQVCSARTRLIVYDGIKDTLLDKVVSRASVLHPDDPLKETTTFGPLGSPSQRDRVKTYIQQGIAAGARTVLNGEVQETGGCYVSPTIFDRVDSGMSIVQEEIFGPVLCVQQFNTDEEAISLANATPYGLAATVWTCNLGRAKRLAHSIRAGHVAIRTSGWEAGASGCVLSQEPQKASGFGAELGLGGLQSYSNLKSISLAGS